MTLARTVVVLGGTLAVMLVVVVLRTETSRLHYQMSQLDREAAVLRQQLRERELELARLRNPARIRARALDMRFEQEPPAGDE
ncbi:MAG: hypothetical protein JXO22_01315 [Phycisphaerae bacterium]|nr:hypothetical protein [Phycisphaerae bacterium]